MDGDYTGATDTTAWLGGGGTFHETLDYANPLYFGVHDGYYSGLSAGSHSLGMTSPAVQDWGIGALEILAP